MVAILDSIQRLYDGFERERLEGCVVNDRLEGDDLKVVLLFESPHGDELGDGNLEHFVAVGATGRSVTKLLDALVHQACPMSLFPSHKYLVPQADGRHRTGSPVQSLSTPSLFCPGNGHGALERSRRAAVDTEYTPGPHEVVKGKLRARSSLWCVG